MQVESAPPGITDSIQEGPGHQKTVMPLANTQNCSGDILLCLGIFYSVLLIPPSTDGPSRSPPTHRFFFCSWRGCCHTSLIPSWFSYSDLHSCADSSELPEIVILYNRLTSLLSISFNQQRIKSNFLASMQDSPPPGVHLCGYLCHSHGGVCWSSPGISKFFLCPGTDRTTWSLFLPFISVAVA